MAVQGNLQPQPWIRTSLTIGVANLYATLTPIERAYLNQKLNKMISKTLQLPSI